MVFLFCVLCVSAVSLFLHIAAGFGPVVRTRLSLTEARADGILKTLRLRPAYLGTGIRERTHGPVAQLGERYIRIVEVSGSSPLRSTPKLHIKIPLESESTQPERR